MREREHKGGQKKREKQTLRWVGSPTWGWIPGPWDHDLSRRQMLNRLSPPRSLQNMCIFTFTRYSLTFSTMVVIIYDSTSSVKEFSFSTHFVIFKAYIYANLMDVMYYLNLRFPDDYLRFNLSFHILSLVFFWDVLIKSFVYSRNKLLKFYIL